MMQREDANEWPASPERSLANLQDRPRTIHPKKYLSHEETPRRLAGRTDPLVPHPPAASAIKTYRTIAITSCEIVSKVVTVFELASNER
jgi:hypothetical protein